MKTAIAFLTKDRVDLSELTIQPLRHRPFDLFSIDGSTSEEGRGLPHDYLPPSFVFSDVRGGAGAGIVFALTKMLEGNYDFVGLCENDVLLPEDWFARTMALFDLGAADGLSVGAVSARCYLDRVLFQRDSYAVCHNLGAGAIVLTREAAKIVLNGFRSGWTTDNRRIFSQLGCGDIGPHWAFKGGEHPLVADWHFDATLAKHGLASLALTPSHVEMIGQDPPLAEQDLTIVKEPVAERIDNAGFERYRERLQAVRDGKLVINAETTFQFNEQMGGWVYLPHQMHMLGGRFIGSWRFKEARANGEFTWVAGEREQTVPAFEVPLYGHAAIVVSGGDKGGQIVVEDMHSGYKVDPVLVPEGPQGLAVQLPLPAGVSYRNIRFTALTPGVKFFRIVTREPQPVLRDKHFDYSILPEPVR